MVNQRILKNWRTLTLLLFLLGGCGQSYEASLVEWNNALKEKNLSRLSTISGPSLVEKKRQAGLPLKEAEQLCLSSSWNEDSADRIMGILSKKAGHSLFRLKEWLDILVFYSERSHDPTLSFQKILTSSFQYRQSPPYSALVTRKELIEEGYFLYSGE